MYLRGLLISEKIAEEVVCFDGQTERGTAEKHLNLNEILICIVQFFVDIFHKPDHNHLKNYKVFLMKNLYEALFPFITLSLA